MTTQTTITACGAEHPVHRVTCILPPGHTEWHRDRIRHYTEWGPQAQDSDRRHEKKKKKR